MFAQKAFHHLAPIILLDRYLYSADKKYTRCKQDYIYNYNRVIVNTEQ